MNKVPVQVYVDRSLYDQLVVVARRHKSSQSALIRKYILHGLEKDITPDRDPALEIIGMGEGRSDNLSENHDRYLAKQERDNRYS